MRVGFFLCVFLGFLGCQGDEVLDGPKAILGENDLILVGHKALEAKHGSLTVGQRRCHGFLSYKNHVTSALHCIGRDPFSFIGFLFQNRNGEEAYVDDIVYLDSTKDLVTYSLSRDFDSYYDFAPFDPKAPFIMRGLDKENGLMFEDTCRHEGLLREHAAILYGCDTKPGFSGSPLIQRGKVVGVHIGYHVNRGLNYGVNLGQRFDENSDITELAADSRLEWPHVRLPSKKMVLPVLVGLSGVPFFGGGSCGSGGSRYLVPDHWGIVGKLANFQPACDGHDRCYEGQLGKSRCDRVFRGRLMGICEETFSRDIFVLQRFECREVVSKVYYKAVVNFGFSSYEDCMDGGC